MFTFGIGFAALSFVVAVGRRWKYPELVQSDEDEDDSDEEEESEELIGKKKELRILYSDINKKDSAVKHLKKNFASKAGGEGVAYESNLKPSNRVNNKKKNRGKHEKEK